MNSDLLYSLDIFTNNITIVQLLLLQRLPNTMSYYICDILGTLLYGNVFLYYNNDNTLYLYNVLQSALQKI